jgi:hypothetical protein
MIDLTCLLTFRREDFTPLVSNRFSLQLHSSLDCAWWLDVLDLVPHALETPIFADFVYVKFDVVVEVVFCFESLI